MSKKFQKPSAFHFNDQHFLTSARTIARLIEKSKLATDDHILEIGPGKGHITRALCVRCQDVTAIEIDTRLHARLQDSLKNAGNLHLIHGDALHAPLPRGEYKVFANLPFSKTTAILERLTSAPNPPQAIFVLVEWGAARGFWGQPYDTPRSLAIAPFYEAKIFERVPREAFHPAPKVDAALLALTRKAVPDIPMAKRSAYLAFLKQIQKRGMAAVYDRLTPKQISRALREANLQGDFTAGHISYVQWLCLFRCLTAISRR